MIKNKNPSILNLIEELKKKSRENETKIWRDIAKRLEKPQKSYAEVNLSKIERHAENGEQIIVPGKVLGAGKINKELTIAAIKFSQTAKEKLERAGAKPITITELMEQNPSGTEIKIIK
ncbi:Ribosomal protein L18E [Methanonatronarchaeum thermophilum]|uniref:Large ribosomal subunit protein eL18 n=1 Tax=Methanonatronarchaeum thermophilum TaxID=1927129 RepID=A0A1Y3GHQ3_9EURY|nr:50S ribosomal protein L18e [Methanonatronarchaeum thermophilum]OUJ18965.1 Ribosomal protein L18E [Methanonatronarchaeum thermophilum]